MPKMPDPKWTPGPWLFETSRDMDPGCHKAIRGANHELVLGPYGYEVEGIEVANDSDARLIASAPDLYEALEEMAALMDLVHEGKYAPTSMTTYDAHAALRKARGES